MCTAGGTPSQFQGSLRHASKRSLPQRDLSPLDCGRRCTAFGRLVRGVTRGSSSKLPASLFCFLFLLFWYAFPYHKLVPVFLIVVHTHFSARLFRSFLSNHSSGAFYGIQTPSLNPENTTRLYFSMLSLCNPPLFRDANIKEELFRCGTHMKSFFSRILSKSVFLKRSREAAFVSKLNSYDGLHGNGTLRMNQYQ